MPPKKAKGKKKSLPGQTPRGRNFIVLGFICSRARTGLLKSFVNDTQVMGSGLPLLVALRIGQPRDA